MRLRIDFLGVVLLDVTTNQDANRLDEPRQADPSGAEAITERRPSADESWNVGQPFGPTEERRVGFRA